MTAILCVGEVLVSLTPATGAGLADAHELLISTGGAEANVAVALAGLGFDVRFAGRVGDDALGRRLAASLAHAGVDTAWLELHPGGRTGLYLKDGASTASPMLYYRTGSAASTYAQLPAAALADVDLVHVTGITAALSPASRALVERIVAGPHRVSFDVNHRPALWSAGDAASTLAELADAADIVFVGLDEAQVLWGCRSADDVRAVLPTPSELVVKHGGEPVVVVSGGRHDEIPAQAVDVVEPVGAGDAFAAGYLAGRRTGHDPAAAARWGHALAAAVLRVRSDHASTVTRAMLEASA